MPRIDILREYAAYGDIRFEGKFAYAWNERENMLDIIEPYNLDELVAGKNDMDVAITLMDWLHRHYKHGNPPGGLPDERTPQALMAAADRFDGRTNCRGLSLILAQLLRAYSIKAYHATCYPYEEPFDDCHVVVQAYSEHLGKWIMLDPTGNLYLKNAVGQIVCIDEFREILIAGGEIVSNHGQSNRDVTSGSEYTFKDYCDYMAKNLIRIVRGANHGYGIDYRTSGGTFITLMPEKYMNNEAQNLESEQNEIFITSKESFWR